MREKSAGMRKRQGNETVQQIVSILDRHRFTTVQLGVKWVSAVDRIRKVSSELFSDDTRNGVVAHRVPLCRDVHGDPYRVDLLLHTKAWDDPIAVIAYHQGGSGSTKEKLEHNFATIDECFPCRCIVVLEGRGFTDGVFNRGAAYVERSRGRVAMVMRGVGEFGEWITEGFPYPPIPPQQSLKV